MQLDLIKPPTLAVRPADGQPEPRLWIRRLVIWSAPGIALQDIQLRRGLNIVWSPDPGDRGTPKEGEQAPSGPGHGAGKTLLCRLLRYCLGEPHFAPDTQRAKIASAFKEGRVGAEVVLDEVVWAVVRSIGVMRHDVVRENATLEGVVASDGAATGMAPLVDAIAQRILTAEVSGLIAEDPQRAWLMALAWLARDQECRFGKVTDWRSPASDSGSPARKLSVGGAVNVVRALVGAITPKEHALEVEIEQLDEAHTAAAREVERERWILSRAVAKVSRALDVRPGDLPEDGLLVEALRAAARARVARVAVVSAKGEPASLADLEAQHEAARASALKIEREIAQVEAARQTAEAVAKQILSETPGLSASLDEAEVPTCPVCEVPVDRALAEGCKLSHKLPDLMSLRQRREKNGRDLFAARDEEARAVAASSRLAPELAVATARVASAWERVVAARGLRDARDEAWYAARRIGDEVTEIDRLLASTAKAEARVSTLEGSLERKRADAGAERDAHAHVFARLEQLFDPLVRELLGDTAKGRVGLDGNGLHLTVEDGGERSTPAIDSVKILAFDLAAMCRSIEGAAHYPALLIHDSPREADLGLSIYHRLFRLIVQLETVGGAPLFQYVVTTTTRPPDDLCVLPWLRLTIQGSPAEERLLKCNL